MGPLGIAAIVVGPLSEGRGGRRWPALRPPECALLQNLEYLALSLPSPGSVISYPCNKHSGVHLSHKP